MKIQRPMTSASTGRESVTLLVWTKSLAAKINKYVLFIHNTIIFMHVHIENANIYCTHA